MRRFLFFCFCSALLICFNGCAKTPDDVKERVDILEDKGNSFVDSSNKYSPVEYGSLEVIRNNLEEDIANNNSSIQVKTARVGTGDIMPVYNAKASVCEDVYPPFKEATAYLFDGIADASDDNLYTLNGDSEVLNSGDYYTFTPKNDIEAGEGGYPVNIIRGNGSGWGTATGFNDQYWFEEFSTEKIYNPMREEISDNVSYVMYDGNEWNLKDAIEFVELAYNENLNKTDSQKYEYKVQTVMVQKLDNNTYGYLFEFVEKDINGNWYESEYIYPKSKYSEYNEKGTYEDRVQSGNPVPIEMMTYLWAYNKEEICCYTKCLNLKYVEVVDEGDNLLTLYGAIETLSNTLADKKSMSIDCAELNYVPYCVSYDGEDEAYENGDLQIRPTWVFRTHENNLLDLNIGEQYYVDALTKEVLVIR